MATGSEIVSAILTGIDVIVGRCLRGFSVMPANFNRAGFFSMREYCDIFPC